MIKKLILLRHGKTPLAGKYAGLTDVDLTKEGEEQIRKSKPYLLKEKIDHVLCSPLLRCRKSLELLNFYVEYTIDPRLQEIDFGQWDGKSFSEVAKSHPAEVAQWAEGGRNFCFPGGECLGDFIARLEELKEDIYKMDVENLLLVAHGGVIRHLICSFLGLPYDNYLLFNVLEGRYAVLDVYDNGAVLSGLNKGTMK